jgi:hypothetical protein
VRILHRSKRGEGRAGTTGKWYTMIKVAEMYIRAAA